MHAFDICNCLAFCSIERIMSLQRTGEILAIDHHHKILKTCGKWAREELITVGLLTVMDERGMCCDAYGVENMSSEATAEVLELIKQRYMSQNLQVCLKSATVTTTLLVFFLVQVMMVGRPATPKSWPVDLVLYRAPRLSTQIV